MKFPASSAPIYFLMQPSFKDSLTDVNNKCISVPNKITGLSIIQPTSSLQPTLTSSGLAGSFRSTNVPESTGISSLSWLGSQYMEYDTLAARYSGTEIPLTIMATASCTSPATGTQVVWSLGSAGTTPILSLQYNGSNIVLKQISSGGTATCTFATDAKLHVFTAVKSATALTLRVDGVQVATAATVSATETFTTFVVGAQNNNGSVSNYLTGTTATIAAYAGVADVYPAEIEQLVGTGIIRSATSGTNVGF